MNKEEKKLKYYKTTKCEDCVKRIKNDGNSYCTECWFKIFFKAGGTITLTA